MKAIHLFLLLLVVSTPAFALKEYYALSRSIRSLGMGGAYYGLSDDEYALFYNPAGLAFRRGGGEGMLAFNTQMATRLISAVTAFTGGDNDKINQIVDKVQSFQGTPLYGSVGIMPYYVRKYFAIGLLIAEPKFDFALLGRDFDTMVDLTAIVDSGLLTSFAIPLMDDKLSIGLTAKGIFRAGGKKRFILTDLVTQKDFKIDPKELGGLGAGIDFDLGATYELPPVIPYALATRVSLVFNNLIGSKMTIARQGGNPPALPRSMTIAGYSILPGWGIFDNFHALVDLAEFGLGGEEDPEFGARGGSLFKHVNLGVEAPIGGWFIPRIGLHQGYLTAGFGANFRAARLEFATYAEELSSSPGRLGSRRFALRLALGFATASNPPYSATSTTDAAPAGAPADAPKEVPPSPQTPPPAPITPAPLAPPAEVSPSPAPSQSPSPSATPSPSTSPEPSKQGDAKQGSEVEKTNAASDQEGQEGLGIDKTKGEDPGTL